MIRSSAIETPSATFTQLISWENIERAWQQAAKGKHNTPAVARYAFKLADNLLSLQERLADDYQPGNYHHFNVHHPKPRKISAAPFEDRIVHHALCQIIEPRFERYFIEQSYANRRDKGTRTKPWRNSPDIATNIATYFAVTFNNISLLSTTNCYYNN